MKLFEMAAKKICEKCGKSMSGNHYWYKGGWKCSDKMGTKPRKPKDGSEAPAKAEKKESPPQRVERKDVPETDHTREMKKKMAAANEEAAKKRDLEFYKKVQKDKGIKDDDKDD